MMTMDLILLATLLPFLLLVGSAAASSSSSSTTRSIMDDNICVSESKTFTVRIDLHASELGYFVLAECGETINPTIAMEIGETYTFVQEDRSNYFHALGFAYSPYGDEDIKMELEPGLTKNAASGCAMNLTCAAPMYLLNNKYLGRYSNIPQVKAPVTVNEINFGLDEYETLFKRGASEWAGEGSFSVKLKIDDSDLKQDIFYFCHIHEFMGGRIKLTKNGNVLNNINSPSLGYNYDEPSEFDISCGSFGLAPFELPNELCPDRFVCDINEQSDPVLAKFASCIDAANCHMMAGMTTGTETKSAAALFIHQMIPHHQNAVNMAKSLLKTETLKCPDISNKDDPECILEAMMYEIIAGQNLQIQAMYDFLESRRYPQTDNCVIEIETKEATVSASVPRRAAVASIVASMFLLLSLDATLAIVM